MNVKFLDPVREVPISQANLDGYVSIGEAAAKTGIAYSKIANNVHSSRRIGSAVVGNARLVRLSDVEALAVQQ